MLGTPLLSGLETPPPTLLPAMHYSQSPPSAALPFIDSAQGRPSQQQPHQLEGSAISSARQRGINHTGPLPPPPPPPPGIIHHREQSAIAATAAIIPFPASILMPFTTSLPLMAESRLQVQTARILTLQFHIPAQPQSVRLMIEDCHDDAPALPHGNLGAWTKKPRPGNAQACTACRLQIAEEAQPAASCGELGSLPKRPQTSIGSCSTFSNIGQLSVRHERNCCSQSFCSSAQLWKLWCSTPHAQD